MDKLEKIKAVMAKRVDITNLKLEDELSALGLDSLDLVELVMEIEEELEIQFEMDEIANFKTLKDLVDCVNSK